MVNKISDMEKLELKNLIFHLWRETFHIYYMMICRLRCLPMAGQNVMFFSPSVTMLKDANLVVACWSLNFTCLCWFSQVICESILKILFLKIKFGWYFKIRDDINFSRLIYMLYCCYPSIIWLEKLVWKAFLLCAESCAGLSNVEGL